MTERAGEKAPTEKGRRGGKHPTAGQTPRAEAPAASSEAVRHSMQGNKRTDTKPELLVRRRLREMGYPGYRLQWKVPGRPDVAYPGRKLAIFVNGCFWHRCPHCHPSAPKTHTEYWEAKFRRNVERDAENERKLRDMGWEVVTVWECELKRDKLDATMERLAHAVEVTGERAREEHAAAHERWLARQRARAAGTSAEHNGGARASDAPPIPDGGTGTGTGFSVGTACAPEPGAADTAPAPDTAIAPAPDTAPAPAAASPSPAEPVE